MNGPETCRSWLRPRAGALLPGAAQTRCRRAGFTLIELIVVVALVGILSALIIPGMHGTYEEALLRSTSRELIDAFQVAYSQSVSFGQPHRFHFDPSTHRYAVEKVLGDEGREDYVPLRDVPGCEGRLDMRIAIHIRAVPDPTVASGGSDSDDSPRPESGQLSFYPDGTADARDVLLEDRDGFRLLLRVNPVTARVRIFELRRQLRDQ